jgi:hypothetical protein
MKRLVVAVLLATTVAACGNSGDTTALASRRVPTALAPSALMAGSLTVGLDAKAEKAFKRIAPKALIADGHLWTSRGAGDRLVGTLQVATLRPDVDLTYREDRQEVIDTVLPGARVSITVAGLDVTRSKGDDQKTVFVWFGDGLFQVLQLKPSRAVPFDPEALLTEVVTYQKAQPQWKPVPKRVDSEDRDGGNRNPNAEDPGWRPE